MANVGVDVSSQRSKSVAQYRDLDPDVVITVCDNAARTCPVWLGGGVVTHIGFPDPAAAEGTREERLAVFERARDGIRERVIAYLEDMAD
jgi:arsenate reductase